jgi:hypothetical protein
MAEMIQFPCPVCSTTLRLPLAMAAARGPCPSCSQEIIAPDPARGLAALKVPFPELPQEIEPVPPEVEVGHDEPSNPLPQVSAEPLPGQRLPVARASKLPLLLSCLGTGLVALAIGFLLGMKVRQESPPPAAAVPVAAGPPAEPTPRCPSRSPSG